MPPDVVFSVARADLPARKRAMRTLAASLLLLVLGLPAWAGDLKVTIAGVRSDSGSVMIGLYDSAEGFDVAIKHATEAGLLTDKSRLVGAAIRAAAGTQSIIFTQLRPGRYAVIAFHDENDNGRLDEGPWGGADRGLRIQQRRPGAPRRALLRCCGRDARCRRRRDDDFADLSEDHGAGPPPSRGLE